MLCWLICLWLTVILIVRGRSWARFFCFFACWLNCWSTVCSCCVDAWNRFGGVWERCPGWLLAHRSHSLMGFQKVKMWIKGVDNAVRKQTESACQSFGASVIADPKVLWLSFLIPRRCKLVCLQPIVVPQKWSFQHSRFNMSSKPTSIDNVSLHWKSSFCNQTQSPTNDSHRTILK